MLEGADLMVVQAELEDRGLTQVLEFESEGSLVEGTAANPRTPGEAAALSCEGGVVASENRRSATPRRAPTPTRSARSPETSSARGCCSCRDGRLALEVIVNDGARRRRLVFPEDGTLESMEDA